jgi:hypothetical protein
MTRPGAVLVAVLVVGSALGAPVGGVAGAASEAPTVEVSVDGTQLGDGDRHETHRDDEITVEAAVGEAAPADVTLVEVVVRVDGDLVESRSVDGETATVSVRPEYDQGENTVRVIVRDSADEVSATRVTVFKDSKGPRVGLREPYVSPPWTGIGDGNVTGTNHTIEGKLFDDSAVERVTLEYAFGDEGGTLVVRDPGQNVSIPHELGYGNDEDRTNRFRMDVVDEFGNTRTYHFSVDVTDGEHPSLSTAPVPNETTRNRVFVAGEVSDDIWVRSVNVTVEPVDTNGSAETDLVVGPREYEYDRSGDGKTATFNQSVHLLYSGTYQVTVGVTDAAGNSVTETFTVERVGQVDDPRPTVAVDGGRTVVTGNESLFLAGSSFEGVTSRLVVETRTPEGDTVDYQVVHSGSDQSRVDFDREVAVADGRTQVIVRAFDPDGTEVTERFFVNGSTRETFVDRDEDATDDGDGNDTDGEESFPLVSVTHLQDQRRGTASSSVTVERAPAGTVDVPSADGPDAVASTGNVTLEGMNLSVTEETSLTGTVVVRDTGADGLRGPADTRPAGTVSIQHSVSADQVDGLALDLTVDRSSLESRGVAPQNLTVYRSADGTEWRELETTLVGNGTDTVRYRVESPGLSVFSLAAPSTSNDTAENPVDGTSDGDDAPGNETTNVTDTGETPDESPVTVTNVTVNRTAVAVNESVAVNATLRNDDDESATYTATLYAVREGNRTIVDSQSVELIPAEERTVRYETAFAEPGNYTVSVNGTQAGPVVVAESGGLLSVFSFVPLRLVGLVLGGIVGLLLVLTLVRFVLRRVGSGGEASG